MKKELVDTHRTIKNKSDTLLFLSFYFIYFIFNKCFNSYTFILVVCRANRLLNQNSFIKNCFASVDGTDCPINELTLFVQGCYLHKFNGRGFCYEVALCNQTGNIIWVHRPFSCGTHPDFTISNLN